MQANAHLIQVILKKRWSWVIAMLLLGAIGNTVGCSTDTASTDKTSTNKTSASTQTTTASSSNSTTNSSSISSSSTSNVKQQTATTSSRVSGFIKLMETDARVCMKNAKTKANITTLNQFLAQMPDDIKPYVEKDAENRIYNWTFKDGSQVVAEFRPKGDGGSEQGLVLYSVDILE